MAVKAKINNNDVDLREVQGPSFSLKKKTDKFYELVGATGLTSDNLTKTLNIPSTKKNLVVIQDVDGKVPTQIKAVGMTIFDGEAYLKFNTKKSVHPDNYNFQLLGDGHAIWEKLDGVSLRELDLGNILWNDLNIIDSFYKTFDDGWKGLFAPAVYGQVQANHPQTGKKENFDTSDFRFSVYFPAITEAIFTTFLGYSIESTFFNLDIFKESVYLYGSGDIGLEFVGVDEFQCETIFKVSNAQTIPFGDTGYRVQYNSAQGSSLDCALWNVSTHSFTVGVTTTYKIRLEAECEFGSTSFRLFKNGQSIHFFPVTSSDLDTFKVFYDETIELELSDGDELYLEAYGFGQINSLNLYVQQFAIYGAGQSFKISSCFHDEKVKDFLLGISHMFNLVWYVNNTIKKVFVEPRFDYVIDGVKYKGFYGGLNNSKVPVEDIDLDMTTTKVSKEFPFGNSITLGYKEDDKEPILKLKYAESEESFATVKFDFGDIGKNGEEKRNPFFSDLAVYSFPTINFGYLPSLVENFKLGDPLDDYNEDGEDERTFKTVPKCGLVYRRNAIIGFKNTTISNAPLVAQTIPFANPNGGPAEKQYLLSYCDQTLFQSFEGNKRFRGLYSTFYPQYMSILKNGRKLEGNANINEYEFTTENFRNLKYTLWDKNDRHWIMLEINKFKPNENEVSGVVLVSWRLPSLFDFLDTKHYNIQVISKDESICDNQMITEDITDSSNLTLNLIELKDNSGWTIPINYPFVNTASDLTRLENELINLLAHFDCVYNDINVSVANDANNNEKWTIEISQTDYRLYLATFSKSNGTDVSKEFVSQNCQ